jgi:phosphatidylglycerophosphate synthase
MSNTIRQAIERGLDYKPLLDETILGLSEKSFDYRDLFLVPSLTSLSGLALVIHGSRRIDSLQGVNEIAAGRGFDLFDGFLARALDQETDLGSYIDAFSDKAALAIIVAAAWKSDIVPKHILRTTAASNMANAALTTVAAIRHPEKRYRPSAAGKHTMALFNASIISHAYASALESEYPDAHLDAPLRTIGNLTFYAASGHAALAAAQYAKRI